MQDIRKNNIKNWFTLIELIVVIAIISILAIASIVVVNKWVLKSKNSVRLSDASAITKNLDSVYLMYQSYPDPINPVEILDIDEKVIALQWKFGTGILDNWGFLNSIPKDPSTKKHYTYTKIKNPKPGYEVWVVLEETQVSYNQTAYAAVSSSLPYIKTHLHWSYYNKSWDPISPKPVSFYSKENKQFINRTYFWETTAKIQIDLTKLDKVNIAKAKIWWAEVWWDYIVSSYVVLSWAKAWVNTWNVVSAVPEVYTWSETNSSNADITAPVLSNSLPTWTVTTSWVNLQVTTDEIATCKYDTSDTDYSSMADIFTTTNATEHSTAFSASLWNNTVYVRCEDDETTPNVNSSSNLISFEYDCPAGKTSDGIGCFDWPIMLKDINIGGDSTVTAIKNVAWVLFFRADDWNSWAELWKSDGATEWTVMVKDIYTGINDSAIRYLTEFSWNLLFEADDWNGKKLWISDGTANWTVVLKDIEPINLLDPVLWNMIWEELNWYLYFWANDWVNWTELWKTDGTSEWTVLVKDIYTGSSSSAPNDIINVNWTLFFEAYDWTNWRELWKSDGTSLWTVFVKDIMPGMNASYIWQPVNLNWTLLFRADNWSNWVELWKSDGTTEWTVMVKDIYVDSNSSWPTLLRNVNWTVLFYATDPVKGRELWQSDGTQEWTIIVKDINQWVNSSYVNYMTVLNWSLYFSTNDWTNWNELWKYTP